MKLWVIDVTLTGDHDAAISTSEPDKPVRIRPLVSNSLIVSKLQIALA